MLSTGVYRSGIRILVIEDDQETADYLRKGLAESGQLIRIVSHLFLQVQSKESIALQVPRSGFS